MTTNINAYDTAAALVRQWADQMAQEADHQRNARRDHYAENRQEVANILGSVSQNLHESAERIRAHEAEVKERSVANLNRLDALSGAIGSLRAGDLSKKQFLAHIDRLNQR